MPSQFQGRHVINRLLENLLDSMPGDSFLQEYSDIYSELTRLRARANQAIRKKDYWDESINTLKIFFASNKHHRLADMLIINNQKIIRLQRAVSLIQKAKSKGKIEPELRPVAELFIEFFSRINKPVSWLSPVERIRAKGRGHLAFLLEQQKFFLLKGKYRKFIGCYEKEKLFMARLQQLAVRLNVISNKLFHERSGASRMLRSATRMLLLLLVSSTAYFAYDTTRDPLLFNQTKAEVLDFLNQSELESEIQAKHGINITGEFTREDLIKLKEYLNHYFHYDFRTIKLNTVYIAPASLFGTVGYDGQQTEDYFKRGIMRLFSGHIDKIVVDHEIAHFWHSNLNRNGYDFHQKWIASCGRYANMSMVFATPSGWKFKDSPNNVSPRYGLIKPYGGKNIFDDVATHVEQIKNFPDTYRIILSDPEIFRKKIDLLFEYGFILRHEAENAKKLLERGQKEQEILGKVRQEGKIQ